MRKYNKILTVVLVGAILCALGFLGYILATPKLTERFTEFYILDRDGQTDSYPVELITDNNQVIQVKYRDGVTEESDYAYIKVGIVNYENKQVQYMVSAEVDGKPVAVYFGGKQVWSVGPPVLARNEKWEQVIGFALLATGDNQKVEFILDKDGAQNTDTLHLRIDVLKRD